MSPPLSNRPVFNPASPPAGGHQEVWYLKLNDTGAGRALWLRFTLLVSADGRRRLAEVWAIDFERGETGIRKTGVKETSDLSAWAIMLQPAGGTGFTIGDCFFSDTATWGCVRNNEHEIRWDLTMRPETDCAFNFVPGILTRARLVKNLAITPFEDLRFSGWSVVDGEKRQWKNAPGMQGHLAGPKNGHSWAWAHCNTFLDEEGRESSCIADLLSARARIGNSGALPPLSAMFFYYNSQAFPCNRFRHALRSRSDYGPSHWEFEARTRGHVFRGSISASLEEFAGVTYEDTDGSHLYCHNSKVSAMTLEIFREGALAQTLHAEHSAAFEFVTREKHPEIHFVI
jgi:hypothetical protein